MGKNVKVTKENESGRNLKFKDGNKIMTRAQFVKEINKKGSKYSDDYYTRKINGVETPVSKPDGKEGNNLG